ncbi:hypothetical protein M8850_06675 [Pasteurella multocida]|uniref:hypothetical protein n=1 Tax=Pasteurella multocida TaxID=747 RepID=UPI0020233684|nr:hypothetical protein [Pasteurella multocida]URH93237.1 hypothetical protein M8850_06675 [Pasteurella multocida]URH99610.1 hypothetical protein M8851_06780 [Pasteurella multocida]HDR0915489.1 DUF2528 family protein [Pasteurella multocida]HEA3248403.1 DUF2528 family protein [Pasteurella multocida]HEA3290531.1 DUF2528 family protein [Pasteurella multocida]
MKLTGKQLVTVETNGWCGVEANVKFVIDFDHPKLKDAVIEMSTFWSGHPDKNAPLEEHLEFWLPLAAHRIFHFSKNYSEAYIIKVMVYEEGYFPLDGSFGIKFYGYDVPDITSVDFVITDWKEIKTVNKE